MPTSPPSGARDSRKGKRAIAATRSFNPLPLHNKAAIRKWCWRRLTGVNERDMAQMLAAIQKALRAWVRGKDAAEIAVLASAPPFSFPLFETFATIDNSRSVLAGAKEAIGELQLTILMMGELHTLALTDPRLQFAQAALDFGLDRTIALIAWRNLDALRAADGLLIANWMAGTQRALLDRGRATGRATQRDKASVARAEIFQAAVDFHVRNLGATKSAMLTFLGERDHRYTRTVLEKYTSGAKAEARRRTANRMTARNS